MRYLVVLAALAVATSAGADQRGRGQRGAQEHQRGAQEHPRGPQEHQRPRASQPQPTPRAEALSRNIPPRSLLPAGSNRFPAAGRSFFPRERHDGPNRPWRPYPGYGYRPYYGGSYWGGTGYSDYYPAEPQPEPEPAALRLTGVLRLEITPATGLQYFEDGVFFGTSAELGTQFELNAGTRRIEIRAAGYRPLMVNARVSPGETVTFRGALEPEPTAAAPPPRASGSRIMYVIPGCYIGNARPEAATLPKGCDITKLVTRGGA